MARDMKRISLTIPDALHHQLEHLCEQRQGATPAELLRSFIRLGMLVLLETKEGEQASIVLRRGEKEKELFLL